MINSSSILEINTKNIIYNYRSLKKIANNSLIGVTIKANAYGLGDVKIFNILYKIGCRNFFVATLEEGLKLRKKFAYGNIYILNGIQKKEYSIANKKKLIPIINSLDEIIFFSKKIKLNKNFNIGMHIDTGINRLGINYEDVDKIKFLNKKPIILVSHLSSSEEKRNKYNNIQNLKFNKVVNLFKNIKFKSLSNSMGALLGKNYHYDMIRPGIAIYGGHYNTKMKNIIKPIIKLKARVLQIKLINKNEYIGYNQTYKTSKKIKVAILGIGYADGVSRILSNNGCVFYKNKKFNIVGRVSMDTITVNITNKKNSIKVGTYMEIINYEYDIEKMANKCKTISNEILTSISERVTRIYI